MALIQCPECGHDISDRAEKCIHCGYPLNEIFSSETHKWRCANCGEMTSSSICHKCGKSSTDKKFEVTIPSLDINRNDTYIKQGFNSDNSYIKKNNTTDNKASNEQIQSEQNTSKKPLFEIIMPIVIVTVGIIIFFTSFNKNDSSNSKKVALDPNRTSEPCVYLDSGVADVFPESIHDPQGNCIPDSDGYYHILFGHHHHK